MMMCKLAVGRLIPTLAKAPDRDGIGGGRGMSSECKYKYPFARIYTPHLYILVFIYGRVLEAPALLHCCQVQSVQQSVHPMWYRPPRASLWARSGVWGRWVQWELHSRRSRCESDNTNMMGTIKSEWANGGKVSEVLGGLYTSWLQWEWVHTKKNVGKCSIYRSKWEQMGITKWTECRVSREIVLLLKFVINFNEEKGNTTKK